MRTATPQISVLFKQQKASKNRNLHQAFWVDFFNNFDKGKYHGKLNHCHSHQFFDVIHIFTYCREIVTNLYLPL